MTFNLFVLPFLLGLIFLVASVSRRFSRWIAGLEEEDRSRFRKGLRSRNLLLALREIFFESLLHRRMFRRNRLLGYMHMSFAFGWLLLILMGNMESRIYSGLYVNPPYYPIFLKFFIHDKRVLPFEIFTVPGFFRFSMDLILLFILSGLVLAIIKRSRSRWFGMKKTTKHQLTDRVALTCLWLIFPARLLAESFTAGAYGYGGGFISQHLGNLLAYLWPFSDKDIAYAFWWLYSLVLGIFFVTLPYSRYMHIPTELLLIFFRNFGIGPKKEASSFSEVEVFSCPRCGVCIDVCQLNTAAGIQDIQSVYFIETIRNQSVRADKALQCLVCGRCQEICPVGINTDSLRVIQRKKFKKQQFSDFSYLPDNPVPRAEVIYFAGCMTHLMPAIHRSVEGIFRAAAVPYVFLDRDGSVCCGRPLQLAGKEDQARQLMDANRDRIRRTGANLMVTSCPICYRIFREEYRLEIPVLHHSQYLLELVKKGKIPLQTCFRKVAYHDPCELGRGSKLYGSPRELLRKVADLVEVQEDDKDSLCCGGSLGVLNIDQAARDKITRQAVENLMENNPEMLVTSCPLCKKTFSKIAPVEVRDIAELVYDALP
ncbi:MAG TPA: (Fe-S)-binding protein [Bacteroidales bacterium]|nr:(Fe-S)-binding protein [Bacteroidales bacterium]